MGETTRTTMNNDGSCKLKTSCNDSEQLHVTFRIMTPDDAEDVAELDAKSFDEQDSWDSYYFFHRAQDDQSVYIVGEVDGKIIACTGVGFFDDAAEIETFAVDPNFRRRGIGTELFSKILSATESHSAKMIFLEVRPSNHAAFKFYTSLGFQIVDRVENFYGDEDAWAMMREIS